jgi:NAD+ kinase
MQVGIVAQRGNARAVALAADVEETLVDAGHAVRLDETTAGALGREGDGVDVDAMTDCDLVVSIGGDGTFLFAARGAGTVPIMGVNLGEVGFLNAVSPGDAVDCVREEVRRMENGNYRVRSMPRLEARGDGWSLPPAINEVVLQGPQRGHGQGVDVEVRVDGSLYAGSTADGVMVSTPTGSSAYNLSEDGPLLHPALSGLAVTEMCAADPMPSLVVADDSEVDVRLDGASFAYAIGDGRSQVEVDLPASVTVTADAEPVRIAGPSVDFFEALGKLE